MKKTAWWTAFFTFLGVLGVQSLHSASPTPQSNLRQQLALSGAKVIYSRTTGAATFVGSYPRMGGSTAQSIQMAGVSNEGAGSLRADDVGRELGPLFGLGSSDELRNYRRRTLTGGRSSHRYAQYHQGLPVFGAEVVITLPAGSGFSSISGALSPGLKPKTTPVLTAGEAQTRAEQYFAKHHAAAALTKEAPVLTVLDRRLFGDAGARPMLAYQTDVGSGPDFARLERYFVDANTGGMLMHYSLVHSARNRLTYDGNESDGTIPGTLRCNEANTNCTGGDTDEVNGHVFARDTYDFYSTHHGRDSFDGSGTTMTTTVHSRYYPCPNAVWNGSQTIYCTGMATDDVVAHEWTHAVTQYESHLVYLNQSGAINESLSDVWGELVDLTNGSGDDTAPNRWKLAEGSALGVIRDMADPPAQGQPDKMSSNLFYTGTDDNGGVHINSGVGNKAAYLMVDGDTFNGVTVAALGANQADSISRTLDIFYEAQTNLLTQSSNYEVLGNALIQACNNLIGLNGISSATCDEVTNAVTATEMISGETTSEISCPAGQTPETVLSFDDYESGDGLINWTATFSGTTNEWYADIVTPYAGNASASADDIDTVGDTGLFSQDPLSLPAGAYLSFFHRFDLETGYDGGVVEISTDGGATWEDLGEHADEGAEYTHQIPAGFGNPLAGRPAFSGNSFGYVGTRYSLNAFAGQSALFRFRLGYDESIAGDRWQVDNVSINTCGGGPAPLPDCPETRQTCDTEFLAGKLSVLNPGPAIKQKFSVSGSKGFTADPEHFGDPTEEGSDILTCVYDGADNLMFGVAAAGGGVNEKGSPFWRYKLGTSGGKATYRNSTTNGDGVFAIAQTSGSSARFSVSAKNTKTAENLALPEIRDLDAFSLSNISVQHLANGACAEVNFEDVAVDYGKGKLTARRTATAEELRGLRARRR